MLLTRLLLLVFVGSATVIEQLNCHANAEVISSINMVARETEKVITPLELLKDYERSKEQSESEQSEFVRENFDTWLSQNITPSGSENLTEESNSEQILEQALTVADTIEEYYPRATMLNDIAQQYANLGKKNKAITILSQSLELAQKIEDNLSQLSLMLQIAKIYFELDRIDIADNILSETLEIADSIEDKFVKAQLLTKIALKYAEIGQHERAETLLSQSQELIAQASKPVAAFPFQSTPVEGSFGFGGIINSFDITTSTVFANLNLSKQWVVDDIDFELAPPVWKIDS